MANGKYYYPLGASNPTHSDRHILTPFAAPQNRPQQLSPAEIQARIDLILRRRCLDNICEGGSLIHQNVLNLLGIDRNAFVLWLHRNVPEDKGYFCLRFTQRFHRHLQPVPPSLGWRIHRRYAHHDIAWGIERRFRAELKLSTLDMDILFSATDKSLHTLLNKLYNIRGWQEYLGVNERVVVDAWLDVMSYQAVFGVREHETERLLMAVASFRDVLDADLQLSVTVRLDFLPFDEALAEEMRTYWRIDWR